MNEEKLKILKLLRNTYCRLKRSGVSGVGVFAIRDIPKNKDVFQGQINEKWYKFKVNELTNLDPEIMEMIKDFFVIEKDKTLKVPKSALNGMDMSFYINHSDKPNVKTIDNGFSFVSLRKIKKDEELFVSYKTYAE